MQNPAKNVEKSIRDAQLLVSEARALQSDGLRKRKVFLWSLSHAMATPVLRLTKRYVPLDEAFEPGARARDLSAAKASAIDSLLVELHEGPSSHADAVSNVIQDLAATITDEWLAKSVRDERLAMLTGGTLGFIILVTCMILGASFLVEHTGIACLGLALLASVLEVLVARRALSTHPDSPSSSGMSSSPFGKIVQT